MAVPDKELKRRMREERRLEKLKAKLEKKYQAGKISNEVYQAELHKIGFTTQKELVEDFRRMIQEEISYLENLDTAEDEGAVPPPPPPPPGAEPYDEPYTDPYGDDYRQQFDQSFEFKKPEEYGSEGVVEPEEVEFIELSEDDIEWEFDEDEDEEVRDEYEDDREDEDDFIDDDHDHEIGVVKVDTRTGVVDYADIKTMEVSADTIMDQLEHAAVLGEEPRHKKKKKRARRRAKEPEPEPELTETEKLIRDMETAPEEELDLDSVFIPDIESTMKKGKVDIMWEADEEDLVWLARRFDEEAELLKLKHLKWRLETRRKKKEAALRLKKYMEHKAEDWQLVKLMQEHILVRTGGKLRRKKREIWKVKIKAVSKVSQKEEKREKGRDKKRGRAKGKTKTKAKTKPKAEPKPKTKPKTKAKPDTKSKSKKGKAVKDDDDDFSDDDWM